MIFDKISSVVDAEVEDNYDNNPSIATPRGGASAVSRPKSRSSGVTGDGRKSLVGSGAASASYAPRTNKVSCRHVHACLSANATFMSYSRIYLFTPTLILITIRMNVRMKTQCSPTLIVAL